MSNQLLIEKRKASAPRQRVDPACCCLIATSVAALGVGDPERVAGRVLRRTAVAGGRQAGLDLYGEPAPTHRSFHAGAQQPWVPGSREGRTAPPNRPSCTEGQSPARGLSLSEAYSPSLVPSLLHKRTAVLLVGGRVGLSSSHPSHSSPSVPALTRVHKRVRASPANASRPGLTGGTGLRRRASGGTENRGRPLQETHRPV